MLIVIVSAQSLISVKSISNLLLACSLLECFEQIKCSAAFIKNYTDNYETFIKNYNKKEKND